MIFKWFACLRHWFLRSNISWTKIKLLFISKGFQIPHFGKSVWIQYFLVTLQRFFWSLYITETYRMNCLTQCKYGKIQTRKNRKMQSKLGWFSSSISSINFKQNDFLKLVICYSYSFSNNFFQLGERAWKSPRYSKYKNFSRFNSTFPIFIRAGLVNKRSVVNLNVFVIPQKLCKTKDEQLPELEKHVVQEISIYF